MKPAKNLSLVLLLITAGVFNSLLLSAQTRIDTNSVYEVVKLKKPMKIDANWNKKQWKKVKPVEINNYMGPNTPKFRPKAQAKMMYDDKNIYVIFHVDDQFMKTTTTAINGGVSGDACVEFFFSPDPKHLDRYFHLETNSMGTPFMAWDSVRRRDYKFPVEEVNKIEIATTVPGVIDPENVNPVTWTLEWRMPIDILLKYAPNMTVPKKGATWKANFFKTASRSSNPHYITWSFTDLPRPDFHQPKFFANLLFK